MKWDTTTRYKLLLRIYDDIVSASTRREVFSAIAQSLKDIFGYDRLSINLFDEKTSSLSYFAAAEGISPSEISEDARPLAKGAIAGAVIRSREPLILTDLSTHTYWQSVNAMKEAGLNATMAFPLIVREKVKGTLHLSYAEAPGHLDEIVAFLREVSPHIAIAVDHMMTHTKLKKINAQLRMQKEFLTSQNRLCDGLEEFIYESKAMADVVRQAKMVANSDVSVAIIGETGTGKDLIAQLIHQASYRKDALFVKINCPALNSSLFESELFGHIKGSFTGAHTNRIGRFEMADKGTVFLDEIGDLTFSLQAKLLQVLQDQSFERVGESQTIKVDFRLISATNQDLEKVMAAGTFRRDLFYRLSTFSIHIPPLRERREDIPLLVESLTSNQAWKTHKPEPNYTPSSLEVMQRYHWPGNVRELKNLVKRLVIMKPGEIITDSDVENLIQQPGSASVGEFVSMAEAEKRHILRALKLTGGIVGGPSGAASLLGVPRQTLQYRMKKHDIKPKPVLAESRIPSGVKHLP